MGSSKRKPVHTTPLKHQAFNGLSALRDALPGGDANAVDEPVPAEARQDDDGRNKSQKVTLQREKKGRAGKTVTRVKGLQLESDACAELLGQMKKALGCGAVLEGEDIVLLANIGPRAKRWLGERGYRNVVLGN